MVALLSLCVSHSFLNALCFFIAIFVIGYPYPHTSPKQPDGYFISVEEGSALEKTPNMLGSYKCDATTYPSEQRCFNRISSDLSMSLSKSFDSSTGMAHWYVSDGSNKDDYGRYLSRSEYYLSHIDSSRLPWETFFSTASEGVKEIVKVTEESSGKYLV